MKNLRLITILIFLIAPLAVAQETYSVAIASALRVAQLDLGRVQHNAGACRRYSQLPTCSQAQVCVAANVVGGASCTAADALAAGVRIYPNTLAGREGFIGNELVRAKLPDYVEVQAREAMAQLRTSCLAANQAGKDAICTGIGQAVGCGICESFQ